MSKKRKCSVSPECDDWTMFFMGAFILTSFFGLIFLFRMVRQTKMLPLDFQSVTAICVLYIALVTYIRLKIEQLWCRWRCQGIHCPSCGAGRKMFKTVYPDLFGLFLGTPLREGYRWKQCQNCISIFQLREEGNDSGKFH